MLLCTQKAVIFLQTIASQKNPAARLPEVRPICTFHMKKLEEYLENVQWIFLRTEKFFSREIFQSEDDNRHVHQKKNLTFANISNPLFITLRTSLLPFLLRCFVTKRRAKTAGKTRNTTDFHANSNPLEDISNPPCYDVTLLCRIFHKSGKALDW